MREQASNISSEKSPWICNTPWIMKQGKWRYMDVGEVICVYIHMHIYVTGHAGHASVFNSSNLDYLQDETV